MSDEEVQITSKKGKVQKTDNNMVYKAILAVVAVIVIGVGGFFIGINYQKHHGSSTAASTSQAGGPGAGRGFGGFGNRAIGTVSAISSSSITISERSGGSKTYTINSSTVISDNGSTTSSADIKTGDTVFITLSSSSSTVATRILVNPSFGGFGGGGGGNSGSSTSGSNGSSTSAQSSNTSSNTTLNIN